MATDVLDEEGTTLAKSLAGEGLAVEYDHLDVPTCPAGRRSPRTSDRTHGRVDALVNNAGVAARERLPTSRSRPGS